MKKLLLFTLVFFFSATVQLYSANPIPSYDVKVTSIANFQEKGFGLPDNQNKEKRLMNVQTSTATPGKSASQEVCRVYLYKQNSNKFLGPYYINPGEILSVEISNEKWGVLIEMVSPGKAVLANVWINSGGSSFFPEQKKSEPVGRETLY